ncbi:LysM peptidoglycan-binding domain-containing M23 family metallopeptidase [Marivita hallyeonensis]|uniref:Murein DD-endopeptidase MepM and murein hydrolase activator NlpD, contain LysM domain n=1 Tax=Marivita hallyeonensis TaxID=996342 RepID=A0A1M5S0F3_9RHOB|nr:LysM peptidoglycan-binding domain-containing M23 family metallopeptidase [Marivita hallyeonensis]SHH31914.1 Murein DD-endopeptidase MepM and murein hydrolase activator NlpD, contain LysM domain [Marivita hallyeonensis]
MAFNPLFRRSAFRLGTGLSALALLTACSEPLDLDMRGIMNGGFNTADAARAATAQRPDPDDRGVISYPNYQVAVARRGDTLGALARRVGLPAEELARFNGIQTGDVLRAGEIIALPRRVAEPSPATGAVATGPIRPPSEVDITTLASDAIERSAPTPARQPAPQTGNEPVRHKVKRGETAFTIARLYNVSVRSLAEWNGLDSDFSLREGQFLLIPVATAAPPRSTGPTAPGTGSPTPQPPSASQPLPDESPAPASQAEAEPEEPVADVGAQTAASASNAAMSFPVQGSIIREYAKGRNDGIDIGASVGTSVKAAASGQVAAITTNTDGINILVVRHPDNLLTVYTHVDGISVSKGDAVSRGQTIAKVADFDPPRVHFEVRKGFDSVDPMDYLR